MRGLINQLTVPVLTIFIALLLIFGLSKLLGPIPFTVNSIQTTNADLFTVSGVGEVQATPKNASVSLGVTQEGTTAEAAQNEVNKVMNALIADIKSLGVEEKAIKTTNLSVNPTYDFNAGQRITGYSASQNVEVQVEDVELANRVVDTATQNGANVISGVSFEINDEEKEQLEAEARKKAVADAKEKAEQIAREVGIRLGRIVNVQIDNAAEPPVMFSERAALDTMQKAEPTNLQPGQNTVTVTVSLSYETL